SSETGSGHKAQGATQIVKGECATKPALDQPRHQNRFARVANALEQRGPNVSVAHEVGSDGGRNHADRDGNTHAPTPNDENTGSKAGGGPNSRHVLGLGEQGKAKPRCQKIHDSDGACHPERSYPPPRSAGGGPKIPKSSIGTGCYLQGPPEKIRCEGT